MDALQANTVAAAALESAPPVVRESVAPVFAGSDFVAQSCARDEKLLATLIAREDLRRTLPPADFAARAPTLTTSANAPGTAVLSVPETQALSELRRWRRYEMVRIAWRDLAGWADLPETLSDLSAFADAVIDVAVQYARRSLVARYGEPRDRKSVV